jgi:anti-sigma regulatory factor (Ser/Thr protein kinase)
VALTTGETLVLRLADESGVGEARRAVRRVAIAVGLDDVVAERAALVVTEAARNVVRHGRGGFVALRALEGAPPGVEVLAVDTGPGIPDLTAALRDGHSTAGTPGQGLGAIRRLATRFDVWTAPGGGTALAAEIRAAAPAALEPAAAALSVARRGESVCGDAWLVLRDGGRAVFAVVDGLGHGAAAHEAAHVAISAMSRAFRERASEIVQVAHDALRATRGAALGVLELLPGGVARYAGLGNVSAAIVADGAVRRLVSLAGTAGHEVRRVQEFSYEWPAGGLLVMHSDGIGTQWALDRYPGLALRAPALVAAILFRDFERGRDDATVLAARRGAP